IGTAACILVAVAGTWFFARRSSATTLPQNQKEDTVKLLVAYSKPLMAYANQSDPDAIVKKLFASDLKTKSGKRIEVEQVGLSSRELIDGVLGGTLKAHVIVPSSDVFLELADRESMMRTGKPLISEK